MLALLERGAAVGSYTFDGYWLDIGREEDFRRAQADADRVLAGTLPKEPANEGVRHRRRGYVGALTVDELLAAGHEVTVLDSLIHGQKGSRTRLEERARRS